MPQNRQVTDIKPQGTSPHTPSQGAPIISAFSNILALTDSTLPAFYVYTANL